MAKKSEKKSEKKSDSSIPVASPQVYEPGHEQPINLPKGPNLGTAEKEE